MLLLGILILVLVNMELLAENKKSGIYLWYNNITGKYYVGSATVIYI